MVLRIDSQLTGVVRPPGIGLSSDRAVSDAVQHSACDIGDQLVRERLDTDGSLHWRQ